MQEILKKFKLNENLIYEYKNWYLVLREEQITFASMVLIEKNLKKDYQMYLHKVFKN